MSTEDYRTGREGEFTFRGHTLEELQSMDVDEVAELLPARQRRTVRRTLTDDEDALEERRPDVSEEHQKLLHEARDADPEATANDPIRTHLRDMPVLPSFVEKTFAVYDGQEFTRVRVEPEMIGHYLGEFVLTRQDVEHGQAGIGATRSSKFVPLK